MRKSLIPLSLAVLSLAAVGASAQTPYIAIHQDEIDPAQMQMWEENAKDWAAAYGVAGVAAEDGWQAFQSGFSYAWVGGMPNYAYLDAQPERMKKLSEALGEGKMEALAAAGAPAVLAHHNELWKFEAEMSFIPEGFSAAGMKAINVSTVTIKAGMDKEYRELVKEAIAALKTIETPVHWFAYSVQFGVGSYAYVSYGEDRAALHSVPEMAAMLTEAVGAEKFGEMFATYLKSVAATEDRDWRVRADLSYMGPAPMEEKEEGSGG